MRGGRRPPSQEPKQLRKDRPPPRRSLGRCEGGRRGSEGADAPDDGTGRDAGAVAAALGLGEGDRDTIGLGGARAGATGLLAASVFHFGDFTVRQAKEHMRSRGIEVRL